MKYLFFAAMMLVGSSQCRSETTGTADTLRERSSSISSFRGGTLPARKMQDEKMITRYSSFVYYYRHDEVPIIEAQVSVQVRGLENIAFQVGAASNLTLNYRSPYAGGCYGPVYQEQLTFAQAFVGLGYTRAFGPVRANIFFAVAEERFFFSGLGMQTCFIESFSPSIETKLFGTNFGISLGAHIYLNKQSLGIPSESASVFVGAGYSL